MRVVDRRRPRCRARQHLHIEFDVMADLEDRRILEQRLAAERWPRRADSGASALPCRRRSSAPWAGAGSWRQRDIAGPARRRSPATRRPDRPASRSRASVSVSTATHARGHRRRRSRPPAPHRQDQAIACGWRHTGDRAGDRAWVGAVGWWRGTVAARSGPCAVGERRAEVLRVEEGEQGRRIGLAQGRSSSSVSGTGTSSFSRTSSRDMRACVGIGEQRFAPLGLLDLAGAGQQRVEIAVLG